MLYQTATIRHVVDLLIRVNATLCFIGAPTHIDVYGYDPRWHVYMKVRLMGTVTDAECDDVKSAVCSVTLNQRINALLDSEFEFCVEGGHVALVSKNYQCTLGIPRTDGVPELARELNERFMVRIDRHHRMQIPRQVGGMQTSTGMITFRVRDGALTMVNREEGAETTCAVAGRLYSTGEAEEYEGTFTAEWFKKIISARVWSDAFIIFSGDYRGRGGNIERAPMVVRYEADEYEFYLMLTEGVCRTRPSVAANRRGHKQKMRLDKEVNEFKNQ